MFGMIIGIGIMISIGILFTVLGCLIWKKERINLFHEYHMKKVSEKDQKAFCKISGIGVLLIGMSLFVTAVILGMTNSAFSFISFAAGLTAGVILLIIAGIKYNKY